MNELTAKQIQELATDKSNIEMSSHANIQCIKRIINSKDILNVLLHGEIIEQYPNDYPFPSCLELGMSLNGKPLHVCCAIGGGKLWVITAYFPDSTRWEIDNKTRKVVNK